MAKKRKKEKRSLSVENCWFGLGQFLTHQISLKYHVHERTFHEKFTSKTLGNPRFEIKNKTKCSIPTTIVPSSSPIEVAIQKL